MSQPAVRSRHGNLLIAGNAAPASRRHAAGRASLYLSLRARRGRIYPYISRTMGRGHGPCVADCDARHAGRTRDADVSDQIEFLVAFFGCQIARVIAVPMMVPRRVSARDSSASIMANCTPAVVLSVQHLRTRRPAHELPGQLRRNGNAVVDRTHIDDCGRIRPAATAPNDTAFLQYTSGSTSDPKGVVVTHANLLANLEMIRVSLGNTKRSAYVNWVPLYHDMGLILNALQAIYVGAPCVLLTPNGFMQRPLTGCARSITTAPKSPAGRILPTICAWRAIAPTRWRDRPLRLESCANGAEPVRARDDRTIRHDLRQRMDLIRRHLPGLRHGGSHLADLRRPPRRRQL